jgi:hypothetical protein
LPSRVRPTIAPVGRDRAPTNSRPCSTCGCDVALLTGALTRPRELPSLPPGNRAAGLILCGVLAFFHARASEHPALCGHRPLSCIAGLASTIHDGSPSGQPLQVFLRCTSSWMRGSRPRMTPNMGRGRAPNDGMVNTP